MKTPLSPSRLNDYLGCPHQAALWLAGAKAPAPDATIDLIRTKGFEHEAKVLAHLETQYGKAVHISGSAPASERDAATRAAVAAKAPLIYQGALIHGDWIGFPDFLVRKPVTGGAFVYEPEDAKLAHKAKVEHVLQLGIYAELLAATHAMPVARGTLHVACGGPVSFDLAQTRQILRRLMRRFEAFCAAETRTTRAIPCAACAQCDFKPNCEAEWRAADSPFFVAGVSGAQVLKLEEAGVKTLAELAAVQPDVKVAGMGADTVAKLAAQASLQLRARADGKPHLEILPTVPGRGFYLLPPPDPGDLFFDLEGDALYEEGLEYLFGVVGPLDDSAPDTFHVSWAHNHAEEKAAFEALMRRFVRHIAKYPDAHIYHYAAYELTALKRLAMRYATMEAELDTMLYERRFVDLYRVVRQAIRASTEGYSLKDLEQIYRGKRAGDVTTAADSIVEYEKWRLTGEAAILESIAYYNKEDCVSTAQLRDWLEDMRPPGVDYRVVDEADDKPEQSAARKAREAAKRDLARRVRASASGNADLRELVAELLWFHQRAQKPGWWSVFERQSWSEDELVDDPESLGDLVPDPSSPPVLDKRSVETTFRFPPQDTKLRTGGTPKIAETLAPAGTIVDLMPEDGFIVLRRGTKAGGFPDRFSLLSTPLNQRDLPEAVMAFAERFAAGALESDTAVMHLLERRAPRLKGRAAGLPLQDVGEPAGAAATRAVLDLDNSYIFIQGPPGTGKTYTAAEIAALLLSKGFRVGVASNSHKAINNVLEEIEKRAVPVRLTFSGAKKGRNDEPDSHFNSRNVRTVFDSKHIGRAFQLVGGTAFHFCRDDQRQQFDYLIVDEAGQVSLGNIVAMGSAARNLVLVGDQMQLAQPVQGVHPGESGLSSLEYLLQDKATVPPDRGILLNESRRLHPTLCTFISDAIYDGRLTAHAEAKARQLILSPGAHRALQPAGITLFGVQHEGCTQSSSQEADAIAALIQDLLRHHVQRHPTSTTPLSMADILVVAPYNMQVNLLKRRLPAGTKVGTVDKFQGQQAAVSILSMTTSRGEDAPRGTEFLFNRNRFNVAVSRAQCLAIVVLSHELMEGSWPRQEDLLRLNLFAHAEAVAKCV
ncbi:TM0106 family RecB-like putative nuclease [Bradyrhizobium sp. CB1717]|uniref:TM0106 family RecB-like putative nuclease n=1 Tax=Bradyrhizobium sp. CB1717 TaxID=3039154 RepID=UPI0024B2541F|nr:TM0106 family RecB-like putative nuclease [Bradyrhizobium sp. CB1717]WFU25130.1 TM0106 family RecB-like putative nuclease [Bradyrhizobium sp. CB1717]